jgi:hypothetical protein
MDDQVIDEAELSIEYLPIPGICLLGSRVRFHGEVVIHGHEGTWAWVDG